MVSVDSNGEMTVRGTQNVNVQLSKRRQIEIAIEVVKRQFGVCNSRDYYHYLGTDNKLMLCETDNAGSHEHETRTAVRDSTAEDRSALLIIGILERRLNETPVSHSR
jgi:hypothetical protein